MMTADTLHNQLIKKVAGQFITGMRFLNIKELDLVINDDHFQYDIKLISKPLSGAIKEKTMAKAVTPKTTKKVPAKKVTTTKKASTSKKVSAKK